jgi:hypothetical protein
LLLVVGLLAGTAAAFAFAEGLKLEKSPILGTHVSKVFSPVCSCPTDSASIQFRLRHADHLTVRIENSAGEVVRTMFSGRPTAAGVHTYFWNGRLAGGAIAPDGRYRPRLELDDADRAISLPNAIVLDTVKPHVLSVGVGLSKRGIVVRYRASERAHGLLFVGGTRVVVTYRAPKVGTITITRAALRERGVTGHLAIALRDVAGNVSKVRVLKYVIRQGS